MLKHNLQDFRPTASWPMLKLRAKLLTRLRQFFDERGFLEVETPILSADTVVDRHLDPFCIHGSPLPTNVPSVPGEGLGVTESHASDGSRPHPSPLPKGEGTCMWLQ